MLPADVLIKSNWKYVFKLWQNAGREKMWKWRKFCARQRATSRVIRRLKCRESIFRIRKRRTKILSSRQTAHVRARQVRWSSNAREKTAETVECYMRRWSGVKLSKMKFKCWWLCYESLDWWMMRIFDDLPVTNLNFFQASIALFSI